MNSLSNKNLLIPIVCIESVLLVITFALSYFFKADLIAKIVIGTRITVIAIIASVVLTAVNAIFVFVLPKYLNFLQPLKDAYGEVCLLVKDLSLYSVIIIAPLSGFAEELFFRGLLQSLTGVIVASIVFGLFHIGNKKTLIYGIYTMFIGLYLGLLYIYTGSLWCPILVHCINNAVALPFMKVYSKQYKA
jgi:uncharacterized protein